MKKLLILLLIFESCGSLFAQNNSQANKTKVKSTVRDENLYCSQFVKSQYKISIAGNKIRMIELLNGKKKIIHGFIRKQKIYSDDVIEKRSRTSGRYYKLIDDNFGVLNLENGDYEWFTLCKER